MERLNKAQWKIYKNAANALILKYGRQADQVYKEDS